MRRGEPGDLLAAVRADAILAPYADALEASARSSIRLRPDRRATPSLGGSRVGGRPSAPFGFQWPVRHVAMPTPSPAWVASCSYEPRLLAPDGLSTFQFIAQIDLAAVAPFDRDGLLPGDGTLLFFYDDAYQSDIDPDGGLDPTSWSLRGGQPWFHMREFGADQVDQVRVIHVPGGLTLAPQDTGPYPPVALALSPSQEWTLPSVDAYVIAKSTGSDGDADGRVVLRPDAWSRLAELAYEHRANADIDQMLGWQDSWAHGPSLSPEIGGWASMTVADRLRETQDARLLLQLSPGTYEPTGIRFGRTLYFCVRESDLRRGDFSRAWYDSD